MSLPDEDQAPLLPPEILIGIPATAIADGYAVLALPSTHPRLSCQLDIAGFSDEGWHVRIRDPFGTIVWSAMLKGLSETIEP